MNTIDWVQNITILLTSLAAVLAWLAKLRWSKEFTDATKAQLSAKDSEIQALKTQLDLLKSYTSSELLNHLREQNKEFEEQVKKLKTKLTEADEDVVKEIQKIVADFEKKELEIVKLETEQRILKIERDLLLKHLKREDSSE